MNTKPNVSYKFLIDDVRFDRVSKIVDVSHMTGLQSCFKQSFVASIAKDLKKVVEWRWGSPDDQTKSLLNLMNCSDAYQLEKIYHQFPELTLAYCVWWTVEDRNELLRFVHEQDLLDDIEQKLDDLARVGKENQDTPIEDIKLSDDTVSNFAEVVKAFAAFSSALNKKGQAE